MDADHDRPLSAVFRRDPAVFVLFVIAGVLIVLMFVATAFARHGHFRFLEAVLVLTMAFAVAGAGFGLVRGLRSGRASRRRST